MSGGSVKISSLVVVDIRCMEAGDISNEEAEALLSDEKIVTRKQSKVGSVARKSNVNQLAEVLKTKIREVDKLLVKRANYQVYG